MKSEYVCGIELPIDIIGGKWKSWIIWYLSENNVMRFNELQKSIPNITTRMLTQQLRELEEDKIINRKVYPVVPPKVEYRLTENGEKLKPILDEMLKWSLKFSEEHNIKIQCK